MHRCKYSGFYPFHELFRTAHVIFSDAAVHRKHGYIYPGSLLLQVFYLCKKVAFRLAYLLRSGLFAPMPVVQVAGMEQAYALQIYQERDAYIGGAEGFDTDIFVFVDIPLIYVNGIFRRGTPVFQNIFGEDIPDVGAAVPSMKGCRG